jgi:endogenous inhibitor of DNA gyrase (YacG/DUF329 family)
MSKCLNCGKELVQKEGKKEKCFCGDACRIAHNRKIKSEHFKSEQIKSEHGEIKSEQANLNKSEQADYSKLSDQERIGKVVVGYCHGCGRKISGIDEQWTDQATPEYREKMGDLICICLPCTRKGITHEKLGLAMCN